MTDSRDSFDPRRRVVRGAADFIESQGAVWEARDLRGKVRA